MLAKQSFVDQKYTDAQMWYEILSRVNPKEKSFKILASTCKIKADEVKANSTIIEPEEVTDETNKNKEVATDVDQLKDANSTNNNSNNNNYNSNNYIARRREKNKKVIISEQLYDAGEKGSEEITPVLNKDDINNNNNNNNSNYVPPEKGKKGVIADPFYDDEKQPNYSEETTSILDENEG